jgi:hypothetical protein
VRDADEHAGRGPQHLDVLVDQHPSGAVRGQEQLTGVVVGVLAVPLGPPAAKVERARRD